MAAKCGLLRPESITGCPLCHKEHVEFVRWGLTIACTRTQCGVDLRQCGCHQMHAQWGLKSGLCVCALQEK
eukprot:1156163-Pelagomonas_calceolata.AAC.5